MINRFNPEVKVFQIPEPFCDLTGGSEGDEKGGFGFALAREAVFLQAIEKGDEKLTIEVFRQNPGS